MFKFKNIQAYLNPFYINLTFNLYDIIFLLIKNNYNYYYILIYN